jgi:hypothetical protein
VGGVIRNGPIARCSSSFVLVSFLFVWIEELCVYGVVGIRYHVLR